MMLEILLMLLAGADAPQVTQYKVSPLTLYDAEGAPLEKLLSKEMPPPPVRITGTNEFGYIEITVRGRTVYVRPADVRHTMSYCEGGTATRRATGDKLGASRPGGVRRGAGEDDGLCIPQ
jgi:hypothetical protein